MSYSPLVQLIVKLKNRASNLVKHGKKISNRNYLLNAQGENGAANLKYEYHKDVFQSCEDYILDTETFKTNLKNSCYGNVVNYLINLGSCTEKELEFVRKELENYKSLKLSDEQIDHLRRLNSEYKHPSIDRFVRSCNFEISIPNFADEFPLKKLEHAVNTLHEGNSQFWGPEEDSALDGNIENSHNYYFKNVPASFIQHETVNGSETYRSPYISENTFRVTIIQKDSEIISLKNENAAKDTELSEIQSDNRELELHVKDLKNKFEKLETNTKVCKAQLEDIIREKNRELDTIKENNQRLVQELQDEREFRKSDVDDISKLQNTSLNLINELQAMKQHAETLETANLSQAKTINQLHQECQKLKNQTEKEENETERLLGIIQRLSDKYEKSKSDLSITREEVEVSERRMLQCREQLTTMEQEVSQLISDLGECLGTSVGKESSSLDDDGCRQAKELTQGFARIVREHEKCREHRMGLVKEIERLAAINRTNSIIGFEKIKRDALKQVTTLKEILIDSKNYENKKVDAMNIFDNLMSLLDTDRIEKPEQSYLDVVNEASVVLEKLDKKFNDQEVYQRYEGLLLMELEKMQESLKSISRTVNGRESEENIVQKEEEEKCDENSDKNIIENRMINQILNQVKHCNKLVSSITKSLRDDVGSKPNYIILESQLQEALSSLDKTSAEKSRLQSHYEDCRKKCKELATEIDKMETSLNEKSCDLQIINKKMHSSFEFYRQEKEALQKQILAAEAKFQQSLAEVASMTKTSDDLNKNLQHELQNKNLKLREYDKLNEILQVKLKESEKMVEHLQNLITNENERKIDWDKFLTSHTKVIELIKDKNELQEKNSNLQAQLLNLERSNSQVHKNLTKLLGDNQYLECNELFEKVDQISKYYKGRQQGNVSDPVIRAVEKEIKSQKEKLRHQKKELILKEKEIMDKNKNIELLHNQIAKGKSDDAPINNSAALLNEIEALTNAKSQLENELEQTLIEREDKLNEMHKHYKQIQIELHKNYDNSIRHLETKYMEMATAKGEEKIFNSKNWLESLNKNQLQELHDKICKNSSCPSKPYETDSIEDHKKKIFNNKCSGNVNNKKAPCIKKDAIRNHKVSSSSAAKLNSRHRLPSKELLPSRSVLIPEKDYSCGTNVSKNDSRNDSISRGKL